MFRCSSVQDILHIRKKIFLEKYSSLENRPTVRTLCRNKADIELAFFDAWILNCRFYRAACNADAVL